MSEGGEGPLPLSPEEQERQDRVAIERVLSQEGVKDVLSEFSDRFQRQTGDEYLLSIRRDGLLVAIREDCTDDPDSEEYFRAWALDTTLPPKDILREAVETAFPYDYVDRLRDGGTTGFPSRDNAQRLIEAATLPESRAAEIDDTHLRSQVAFYRKTGRISIPSKRSPYAHKGPRAGGQRLYPLGEWVR